MKESYRNKKANKNNFTVTKLGVLGKTGKETNRTIITKIKTSFVRTRQGIQNKKDTNQTQDGKCRSGAPEGSTPEYWSDPMVKSNTYMYRETGPHVSTILRVRCKTDTICEQDHMTFGTLQV